MTTETKLAEQAVVRVKKGAPALPAAELQALGRQVPDWAFINSGGVMQLRRTYKTADFAQALQFANAVGTLAEAVDHHPALIVEWGRLTVSWWTHTIHGLHLNDVIMAARCDVEFASDKGNSTAV